MYTKRLWCVCIFTLLIPWLVFSRPQQRKKKAWEITDQFRIKSIGDLRVSPDNEYLLFTHQSNIWLLPVKGGEPRQITDLERSPSSARWSPDGKRIAFITSGKDEYSLWVMERDGRALRRIAVFERSNAYLGRKGNNLCWSPCGKFLAYTAAGPRHYTNTPKPNDPPNGNDVMVVDRLLYKAFYYYSDMRRTYVYVISVDGGKPEQISFGDYDYHSISWSPDGKRIACVSNRTGKDDYNANNDICLLSPHGEEMIQLTHTIGPEYAPVYSPDGSWIAYPNRLRDHRSKESDAELHKIYVIPANGGTPVNLSASLDRWSSSQAWSEDSQKVYFTAQNSGKVCLYVSDVEGGKVTPIVDDYGQLRRFTLGKNGEIFFITSDFTHPAEIYKTNIRGGQKQKLTSFNKKFTEEVEIIEPEEFTCASFDGWEIEGWIMKPHDFKRGMKYPMVLAVHGGPHGQYGYRIYSLFQYLAANGYVVMFTNPRGSSGYGQKFSDGCVGDLGGGDYKDIMACVDHVLEEFDFVDPERLGVTGGSYGGYMTNWIITHTNRFKAAVPVASISNLISQWGTDANALWFESDGGFMPFEDYEKAWDMSPLKYIKNCKTPTLFIHGAWDFCVNLGQAEEMYTALKKLGVDAVLAIYPNEGHGVRQSDHVVDYYRRTLAWFDKYLK
jgi:dipeptidyl aminopeptidase/acylaminoacyl peptidase